MPSTARLTGCLFYSSLLGLYALMSVASLNIPMLREHQAIAEPMLLGLFSFFSLLGVRLYRHAERFSNVEIACLLFFSYIIIRSYFTGTLNVTYCAEGFCWFLVYFFAKSLFGANFPPAHWFSRVLILMLAFDFIVWGSTGFVTSDLFVPNQSVFAILLASQLIFLIPLWACRRQEAFCKNSNVWQWPTVAAIVLGIGLLLSTKGRAGFLGFIVGICFILYQYQLAGKRWKFVIGCFLITGLVGINLLFFKPGSSQGRWLIYKVSWNIFKEHWLFGVGPGNFDALYNRYQAAYFKTHDIDSSEALLADNSFYAFNDHWQLLLEGGVIGFLFYTVAIGLFIRQHMTGRTTDLNNPLHTAVMASLFCVAIGAAFSYPLHLYPVTLHLVVCLALLQSLSHRSSEVHGLPRHGKKLFSRTATVAAVILIGHFAYVVFYQIQKQRAINISRAGFRKKAAAIYQQLCTSSYIRDGHTCYLYSRELYALNQLERAAVALDKGSVYYYAQDVVRLSAKN